MSDKCSVCGRTIEQIMDELNQDSEIGMCVGVKMCSKCESEYMKAHPNMEAESAIPEEGELPSNGSGPASQTDKTKDWKERVTA